MDVSMDPVVGMPVVPGIPTDWGMNPVVISVVLLVVIVYVALFSSVGSGSPSDAMGQPSAGLVNLETFVWGLFILLLLLNGMAYLFNIDVTASLRGVLDPSPEINLDVQHDDMVGSDGGGSGGASSDSGSDFVPPETTVPEIRTNKQTFHVPGNNYTFDDARAICQAYGGSLATYSQVENAYDRGADWCSYGWSDGQMALFPTQKDKWDVLQTIPGHENDCGRPGINGGYIANPNVRFGVNCYGFKPKITQAEADRMENAPLYPQTAREIKFEKLVRKWADRLPEILVAPFNHNNWSMPSVG